MLKKIMFFMMTAILLMTSYQSNGQTNDAKAYKTPVESTEKYYVTLASMEEEKGGVLNLFVKEAGSKKLMRSLKKALKKADFSNFTRYMNTNILVISMSSGAGRHLTAEHISGYFESVAITYPATDIEIGSEENPDGSIGYTLRYTYTEMNGTSEMVMFYFLDVDVDGSIDVIVGP